MTISSLATGRAPGGSAVSRLLAGAADGPSYPAHLQRYGWVPMVPVAVLVAEVERAGIVGRGGAGFPLARKLHAVAGGRGGPVVVANGCEGEPASAKDALLLTAVPHLVLDGLQSAAHAVGARAAHVAVHHASAAAEAVRRALHERADDDSVPVRVVEVPRRYVASEESALVHLLNGGAALPTTTPPRPYQRGVGGRPTLINNVETLAQLALVSRRGAAWFREVGDSREPGTQLLTLSGPSDMSGGHRDRHVVEIVTGCTIGAAFAAASLDAASCSAVLVGGYFGSWLAMPAASDLSLSHHSLRAHGAALGAGVLVGLPRTACGLAETARVAGYLAGQSAGQCGPCLNGLPAIAGALRHLAHGPWDDRTAHALSRWLTVVPGRGACRHPDGAVRLVASALEVFAEDVLRHRTGTPCAGERLQPVLPVPEQAMGFDSIGNRP